MKLSLLAFALGASAFVINDGLHSKLEKIKNAASDSLSTVKEHVQTFSEIAFDQLSQVETDVEEHLEIDGGQHTFELFDQEGHHGKRPHKKPHQPPPRKNPHDQRDKSIYEFIASSEYFTTLHSIIEGDRHAVEELNKTSANLTLFAPTNKALEKYEKHTPSVEHLRKILLYHLLPDIYPAGRVLKSKTLESLYFEEELNTYQRLAVDINLRGITLNYYTRIIYIDVFTNNGVVHAVDNLLFPPPPIYIEAELMPSTFSTFVNAAWKTGLVDTLNKTSHSTIFAPSNFAFAKLGAKINAYLFSTRGQPVLTKLLKYHIVPDILFYSDLVYKYEPEPTTITGLVEHYEFENLLGDTINVDVGEWGRFKSIVFNGRRIGVRDLPAKNGVLSTLDSVILPYKHGMTTNVEDMSIEEFESLFDDQNENVKEVAAVDKSVTRKGGCRGQKQGWTLTQMKDQMLRLLLSDVDVNEDQMFALL